MTDMTIVNPATDAEREAARRHNGQFGNQQHSVPEATVGAPSAETVRDLWDERKAAAKDVEVATVGLAMSHLPDNLRGIRYVEKDGQLIPALLIPTTPGGHVAAADFVEKHLPVVTAYANSRTEAVELEPVTEEDGRQAWEWIPDAERRAVPAEKAEDARWEALTRFHEANYDFNDASEAFLRANMPEGAERVEVAYGPVTVGWGRYMTVPEVTGAYDADGELLPLDVHANEFADYRVNVARTDVAAVFPSHFNETGAAIYTITRKATS